MMLMDRTVTLDFEESTRRLVQLLKKRKLPMHYAAAYDLCGSSSGAMSGFYSTKSDPVEKFRQAYIERKRPGISRHTGGYIGLCEWFPRQIHVGFLPPEPIAIPVNLLCYESAAVEARMRQAHMKDFYNLGEEKHFIQILNGLVIEKHVSLWLFRQFPNNVLPPSNSLDYTKPSKDDLRISVPWIDVLIPIDVKGTYTDFKNNSENAFIRSPDRRVCYLLADFDEDKRNINIKGWLPGDLAISLGESKRSAEDRTRHIMVNYLWSIESLLVILNMAANGMDWSEFRSSYIDGKVEVII